MNDQSDRSNLAKAADLKRFQRLATACVAVALLFRIACCWIPDSAWVGYLRAFAEAAVVGGLADWFAVTALFRHPLGLAIPHTRIIPRSKERIAKSLGEFIVGNFLSRTVVDREVGRLDLCTRGAEYLRANAEAVASRICSYLPAGIAVLDDDDISRFLEVQVVGRVRRMKLGPVVGRLIELLTADGRHEKVTDDILKLGEAGVRENRDVIVSLIRKEIPVPESFAIPNLPIALPLGGVKDRLAGLIAEEAVKRVLGTLAEMRDNPGHELRTRLRDRIARFASDLKTSPEMLASAEEFKEEFLANPHLGELASKVWLEVVATILDDLANPDGKIKAHLAGALLRAAEQVASDAPLRDKLNSAACRAASEIVSSNAGRFAGIIEDTVARWDGDELSVKIELEVGKDLQFVRLNGTLVGGMLGVVLHGLVSML